MPTIPTDDFPNPLVKQIFFEIKFPNLFSVESKIGEFQLQIVEKFPDSSLLFQRQVVFANLGPEVKIDDFEQNIDKGLSKKIWQFKSSEAEINITTNGIIISSPQIKKYSNTNGYRELLNYILNKFFAVMSISVINRIGLRYVNEFDIEGMSNATFNSFIKSSLQTSRFSISNSKEMTSRIVENTAQHGLIFMEAIRVKDNRKTWILDLDSFATNKSSDEHLSVADTLHSVIKSEFFKTIKPAIYPKMRNRAA